IESVLPQLFPSSSALVHARSFYRRFERLCVPFLEQSLGGGCCRLGVPGSIGTNPTSPNRNRCSRIICCSSGPCGSDRVDLEPERSRRCRISASLLSNIFKIQAALGTCVVRCFHSVIFVRLVRKAFCRCIPSCISHL